MTAAPGATHATKVALIEAAYALFAERGFDLVSVRDITGRAGANVASVKYHFGSREDLIDAVVAKIITPVNEERLRILDGFETRGSWSVRDLLEALVEPLLFQIQSSPVEEKLFCKLMGRIVGDRPYEFKPVIMAQFRKVAARFVPAFSKVLPGLSDEEILWRMHFSFGVLSTSLIHGELFQQISEGMVRKEELKTIFARIVDFCAAGFQK